MRRRHIEDRTPTGSYPEPTASECAIGIAITGVTRNTVSLSWTAGATGTKVMVLASGGADFTTKPVDFTSNYTADASYPVATDLNGGTTTPRVVYAGDATAMTISGFAANTLQYIKVFTFKANANNDYNTRNYNTINALSTYVRTSR